jgi:uncharacterized protein
MTKKTDINMPSHNILIEFDVPATMRDGVTLYANVYRPVEDGQYPVVLSRTIYGKDYVNGFVYLDMNHLVQAGYIVVVQDVRGSGKSEGDLDLMRQEAADGYDSVEWAATLPGSNGNVGMYGISYLGWTQMAAAMMSPPHLKAIMPAFTWSDARGSMLWRQGAFEFGLQASWLLSISFDPLVRKYIKDNPQLIGEKLAQLIGEIDTLKEKGYVGSSLDAFTPIKKLEVFWDYWKGIIKNPNGEVFSSKLFSPVSQYDQIQVPSYHIGGWYDMFNAGTLENFVGLGEKAATEQARQPKLLIGPWSHINYSSVIGDIDFGSRAQMAMMNGTTSMAVLAIRWFDYWLKGIENGIMDEPPVKIFVMGDNTWRDEETWPLKNTQFTPYYLQKEGRLANKIPTAGSSSDSYEYDPQNPVITYGGALHMNATYGIGAKDQRPVEARDDVLSYTTLPLEADMEVTGPVKVKLYAASSAPDTDFVARLVDVHPDGFAQNLTDGIIRARYRNGNDSQLLTPGEVTAFEIDLWATANVFKAGHSIRVDITSSNFPRWDRNPNSGQAFGTKPEYQIAEQTIYHTPDFASHILLPVIPRR